MQSSVTLILALASVSGVYHGSQIQYVSRAWSLGSLLSRSRYSAELCLSSVVQLGELVASHVAQPSITSV